jgi:hypothetical protein
VDDVTRDLGSCRVHEVRGLPGSNEFASRFLEAIAVDAKDRGTLWGLTADLSTRFLSQERSIYLSKSTNGGARWTEVLQQLLKEFVLRPTCSTLRTGINLQAECSAPNVGAIGGRVRDVL